MITVHDLASAGANGFRLTAEQRRTLVLVVPERSRPYMDAIFRVEDDTLGIVSSLLLWAIMEAETLSGTAKSLDRPGPAGTGDHGPRDPAVWGRAMPPDGRGWGRGLFQIDFGSHDRWLLSHDWTDPYTCATKAAELLAENLNYFLRTPQRYGIKVRGVLVGGPDGAVPDVRPLAPPKAYTPSISAYNARRTDVLLALGRNLDCDTPTHPYKQSKGARGYARSVLSAIDAVGRHL